MHNTKWLTNQKSILLTTKFNGPDTVYSLWTKSQSEPHEPLSNTIHSPAAQSCPCANASILRRQVGQIRW